MKKSQGNGVKDIRLILWNNRGAISAYVELKEWWNNEK